MDKTVRELWAQTRILAWPGDYMLISLPRKELTAAANLVSAIVEHFSAVVLEKDEVSLTVPVDAWKQASEEIDVLAINGPYRVLTLDLVIDLGVSGYLLPAAERLAAAGISIVPQCAYLKDHLLIRSGDAKRATSILEQLSTDCAMDGNESFYDGPTT